MVMRFGRGDCTDIIRLKGPYGWGPSNGGGVWNRMRLSFSGQPSVTFAVRQVDRKVGFLRQALRLAHS
jgi:hypothetical protein